jgi:hypothetical protein
MSDYTVNFITFGSGNFTCASKRLADQAKGIGLFDKVTLFDHDSLRNDSEFWIKHGEFIQNNKRGHGYWLWKPYIIKKTIDSLNDGDRLLYLDAGCEISKRKKDTLKYYIENIVPSEYVISASDADGIRYDEYKWTKMDLINYMNLSSQDLCQNQRQAGATLFYVCSLTRRFVKEWYEIAQIYHFIDDSPSVATNTYNFVEHRHDQSVFSLLSKKYRFCRNYISDSTVEIIRNRKGVACFT